MIRRLIMMVLAVYLISLPSSATSQGWQDLAVRADSIQLQGNSDSAIALGKLAVAEAERALGTQDTVVARLMYRVSKYVLSMFFCKDLPSTESYLKRAEKIFEANFGSDDPRVAEVLFNRAVLYCNHRMNAEAEPLFERVLKIYENAYGPNHSRVAGILKAIGIFHFRQGRLDEPKPYYSRALEIAENNENPDSSLAGELHYLLGLLQAVEGKYVASEKAFARSAAIRVRLLGPDHPDVAACLEMMGNLSIDLGKYARAESLLERSLAINEEILGSNHADLAPALRSLAALKFNLGKLNAAEELYSRSLVISEKILTSAHPEVAESMRQLSWVFALQERLEQADSLARKALQAIESLHGEAHHDVTFYLDNLARICTFRGNYDEAESLCQRSLEIKQDILGTEHPHVASSLVYLGRVYLMKGLYSLADSCAQRSLEIRQKSLGNDHVRVAESLEFMTITSRRLGKLERAEELARQACEITRRWFTDNAYFLSEQDALAFSRDVHRSIDNYLSCHFDLNTKSEQSLTAASSVILSGKGLVADEMFQRQQALADQSDSIANSLVDLLRSIKGELAELFIEGTGEDIGSYRSITDSLDGMANDLEADLARRSARFRKRLERDLVSVDSVQSLLPEGCALLEYVKYDRQALHSDSTSSHYAVMFLPGIGSPTLVDLGPAEVIDAAVERYRRHMVRRAKYRKVLDEDVTDYHELSRWLYELVWRPVDTLLSDEKTLFVSPASTLHMVSFAGLSDDGGVYLIERFALHYLTCGRDLVRLQQESAQAKGLFAMGDPDYNAPASARRLGAMSAADTNVDEPPEVLGQLRSGSQTLRETTLSPLPGSRLEVEQIVTSWQKNSTEPVHWFLGAAASEETLKARATGHRVIHLATHGYYVPADPDPISHVGDPGSPFVESSENPMLRSGLFLAGANLADGNSDPVIGEDGVLTAYEVSALNLKGVGLVVLSACETGLGQVQTGEGVFGLRRAFQMAGARTVISALWPVADREAADLISGVYECRVKNLAERMRQVQMTKIERMRAQSLPDHPVTWAGFVAVGDWR